MSNKTEVEQATDIIDKRLHSFTSGAIACALSAAGLLRTEADRLNAELAEAMVDYARAAKCEPEFMQFIGGSPLRTRINVALRAILDARKPKERWTVGSAHGAPTVLCDGRVSYVLPCGFEPEARAYVARKNAEGAK